MIWTMPQNDINCQVHHHQVIQVVTFWSPSWKSQQSLFTPKRSPELPGVFFVPHWTQKVADRPPQALTKLWFAVRIMNGMAIFPTKWRALMGRNNMVGVVIRTNQQLGEKTGSRHVKDAVLWLLRWGILSYVRNRFEGRKSVWWLGNPNDMILFGFVWYVYLHQWLIWLICMVKNIPYIDLLCNFYHGEFGSN